MIKEARKMQFLTREELAERWRTSLRTVDRRRQDGLVPWMDLTAGKGRRPHVRFRLVDVEELESRMRMDVRKDVSDGQAWKTN
jgi:hypothetical protein